ncbi:cell division control protein [Lichtheimia corymbifera JMRC:FSU:9682]|uniref:Cell division control protein n=1 Tax=Lichtheimia corymbifera JMRC:FSU:9682 TaxID=1263082 RepID=A0A068RGC8_9FUNG|nr:cell division control protein [Lichtheimia corymbifera JMRC:FSU:9682]
MAVPPLLPYNAMPLSGSHTNDHLRISDHFWSNDNTALDIILDRLLKSKRTCETMLKVFEKRAQIEQEYGERLLKLSQIQLLDGEGADSTFGELLESVPTATEATARAHIDLAQQIHHLLEVPLAGFIKDQKAVRKATMAEIDKIQNLRYMHMDNVKRARNNYLSVCANLEEMKKHGVDPDCEEMIQMKQKATSVEQEYKLSLGILESITKSWVEEWRTSCDVFQELEERKHKYLGGTLNSYANMISNVYTTDDQSCDRIRAAYDNLDSLADIEAFIRIKGTGMSIPETPKYTSFEETEDKPKPTIQMMPRTIREINIPVEDEELRSVNDQLNKLPSIRTTAENNDASSPPPKRSSTKIATPATISPPGKEEAPTTAEPTPTHDVVSPLEPSPTKEPPPPSDTELSNEKTLSKETPDPPQIFKEKLLQKALPSLPAEKTAPMDNNNNNADIPKAQHRLSYGAYAHGDKSDHRMSQAGTPRIVIPEQQPYADVSYIPHVPSNAPPPQQLQPTAELEKRISIVNTSTPSINFEDSEENKRKEKKKQKNYSMFPFLKKKQDQNGDERTRFSLSNLRGGQKKEQVKSATSSPIRSRQTSPQSPFFPSNHQHTPSPIDNTNGRFNTMPAKYPSMNHDRASVLEYVQAQWSYDAKIESEMTFSKNDILAVFEKKRDGWWDAQIVQSDNDSNINARGLVPGNFMTSL